MCPGDMSREPARVLRTTDSEGRGRMWLSARQHASARATRHRSVSAHQVPGPLPRLKHPRHVRGSAWPVTYRGLRMCCL